VNFGGLSCFIGFAAQIILNPSFCLKKALVESTNLDDGYDCYSENTIIANMAVIRNVLAFFQRSTVSFMYGKIQV
jgi:hypothetical protein